MKRMAYMFAAFIILSVVSSAWWVSDALARGGSRGGNTHVGGHTRRDGTYVQPHYRTNPNSSRMDNYSTRGNVNPYTGKSGTVDPYKR
jgi:hypothetical protein